MKTVLVFAMLAVPAFGQFSKDCPGGNCNVRRVYRVPAPTVHRSAPTVVYRSSSTQSAVRPVGASCPTCGNRTAYASTTPRWPREQSYVGGSSNITASWGSGRAYQVALQSAQYRAARGIRGHSYIDKGCGMSNGVGWSTSNPRPPTCFWSQRNRGAYVAVRGRGGYYGTLVLGR